MSVMLSFSSLTPRIWREWPKDGRFLVRSFCLFHVYLSLPQEIDAYSLIDTVLNSPRILGVPLLLLANKQDIPGSLSVESIRENYEEWWQLRSSEEAHRAGSRRVERRMASLEVLGVSGIEGLVLLPLNTSKIFA